MRTYIPAVTLHKYISRKATILLRRIFVLLIVLSGAFVSLDIYWFNSEYTGVALGILSISTAFWLELLMLFAYQSSYYYRGLNSLIGLAENDISGATYDVAEAVLKSPADVTAAFCKSSLGTEVLLRSGIPLTEISNYLLSPRPRLTAESILLPERDLFSLIGLGKYLLAHDPSFKKLIKEKGATEANFLGALRWVIGRHHQQKRRERWWSKDNLSKTGSIGREWTFGTAYLLQKFSRPITTTAVFSTLTSDASFANEKIEEIESALVQEKASNVLLLGESGVGKIDLVMAIEQRMRQGESLAAITGKQILVLDTNRLITATQTKAKLEAALLQMFTEAANAGNMIVVIENFTSFIREAESLDVFIPELLDEFLALPQLHIIAIDTPTNYHRHLETLGSFTRRFSEILIDTPDLTATTRVLQSVAMQQENKYPLFFTYGAIQAISTCADRYLVDGVLPDKAIELLLDIASAASRKEINVITSDYVYETVSKKTGVPAGPVTDAERDNLLHLEDTLHQHIIGQDAAITAIARTMRRARIGIQEAEKPIGSFLFLGPTGVGKTETAKTLAKIFFGGEDKLQRLDMSEFSGPDALQHLLGDEARPGVLTTILHEHPYCVLLLDELEKAATEIHDIFLQILDEGTFTNARGEAVNARNAIIIATSNAGSQLILRTVKQRTELATLTSEIISHIIHKGWFRSELINRFDNTIIFEPLSTGEQTNVANLLLSRLYERIQAQGYELKIDPSLLDVLVEKGYSPEFGARSMQRVLQNTIEEKVAEKIIAGTVQKGGEIQLSSTDFTAEELAQ